MASCTHVRVRELLRLSGQLPDSGGLEERLQAGLGLGVDGLDVVARRRQRGRALGSLPLLVGGDRGGCGGSGGGGRRRLGAGGGGYDGGEVEVVVLVLLVFVVLVVLV